MSSSSRSASQSKTHPLSSSSNTSNSTGSPPSKRKCTTRSRTSQSPPQQQQPNPPLPTTNWEPSQASQWTVLHQCTHWSWMYTSNQEWHGQGTTKLFVLPRRRTTTSNNQPTPPTTTTPPSVESLALHLRGTVQVQSIQVHAMGVVQDGTNKNKNSNTNNHQNDPTEPGAVSLQACSNVSYVHADPLECVLWSPRTSTTANNNNNQNKCQADGQCSRGAAGMTLGLRAASIASLQGQLHIQYQRPRSALALLSTKHQDNDHGDDKNKKATDPPSGSQQQQQQQVQQAWKTALQHQQAQTAGTAVTKLQTKLRHERQRSQYEARLESMSKLLAQATTTTTTTTTNAAAPLQVTIHFSITSSSSSSQQHWGGLHVLSKGCTPHIYTTSGVHGDASEGPSCWVPCLDSAAVHHRATHEWSMSVTAPMSQGLSSVGMGQDLGLQQSYMHLLSPPTTTAMSFSAKDSTKRLCRHVLGPQHWDFCQGILQQEQEEQEQQALSSLTHTTHVIPPDDDDDNENTTGGMSVLKVHNVWATSIWCSATWSPISPRSFGFAIGPFCTLADAEYVSTIAVTSQPLEEDDDNDEQQPQVASKDGPQNSAYTTDSKVQSQNTTETDNPNTGSDQTTNSNSMDISQDEVLEEGEEEDHDDEEEDESIDEPDTSKTVEETQAQYIQAAYERGEGIRQVYFAPVCWRKHIFAHQASRMLLPNHSARLALRDLTLSQKVWMQQLEETIQAATVGVPHRALSLMRDLLAVPEYRTVSYTQVWIPNAVHGGCSSGSLHQCPEVMINPFLGGAIMDARLLPPLQTRLPYYNSGRALQFLQARNAIRGWIQASLPLGGGGDDDVGHGYILRLWEALIMSCYERGHGAFGEGGAAAAARGGGGGGLFGTRRYAAQSGLNSTNLDFLPIRNLWEDHMFSSGAAMFDAGHGGIGMDGSMGVTPMDESQNDYLWRSATNGTESHTSGIDEYNIRHLLRKDVIEAVERGTDKDKQVPSPGMGWGGVFGSYLSCTYLSSNASSSSQLGCGAVEMMHPLGGLVYRAMKIDVFRAVVEGRAGIANFLRLARATFVAAHLSDIGEKTLVLPKRPESKKMGSNKEGQQQTMYDEDLPPFVVCVNEILAKGGLTHTLFTRALQNMCGRHREPYLAGTLVDVEREAQDPRTRKSFVDSEGFPNSYLRASSMLYCRVGVQVEQHSRDTAGMAGGGSAAAASKSTQCQIYAEPIIPEGGVAFGGPITVRVVENEGQFREYEKDLLADGSRRDWGSMTLHAKPVSTPQAQTAASGALERKGSKGGSDLGKIQSAGGAFTNSSFHGGGFQAIELVRLTNLSPLLWVRVDPFDIYCGRISVVQPDACLAEELFHDGDASAQVDAIRSLAERPLRIQGSMKVSVVHGVNVSELPVRLLSDCLKGSSALHSSLPHTPGVRSHAALAIAQWQNNKGPPSKNTAGTDSWLGLDLLIEYFQERFCSNSVTMPVKFSRVAIKNSEAEARAANNAMEGGGANPMSSHDESLYEYLDTLDEGDERKTSLKRAEDVEVEEDEEYRVRSACVTAIASIRAQDGQTPDAVMNFLESVLEAEDASVIPNVTCPDDETMAEHDFVRMKKERARRRKQRTDADGEETPAPWFPYNSGTLVADTLLATCHVNAWPSVYTDPATGVTVETSGKHPVTKLIELTKCWLEWELFRERVRSDMEGKEGETLVGGNCFDVVSACAIVALANLVMLKQCTTTSSTPKSSEQSLDDGDTIDQVTTAEYYGNILESKFILNDLARAAAAQALTCICCAADRFEVDAAPALGLLTSLEILLTHIASDETSPSLRQTLAQIMMDACTGKVCSMQRVGAIAGRNDLYSSASRFFCGPLGSSHGGDNGSSMLTTVSAASSPAASAVNDGARRGLKLLNRAGHPRGEAVSREVVVRVAIFATRLWRIINGETPEPCSNAFTSRYARPSIGVCAYDGVLRCSLLSLWLWLWPKGCFAVLQVQSWKTMENTPEYAAIGADRVMKITEEEKAAAAVEENSLNELGRLVQMEIDRQAWRGEMASKSYTLFKAVGGSGAAASVDTGAAEQGIGQPLPPIQRDAAFKQGGWIASAAQQRRALALDGGTVVTKLRLKVGNSNTGGNGTK